MPSRTRLAFVAAGILACLSGEALAQDTVPSSTNSPSKEDASDGKAQDKQPGSDEFSLPIRIIGDPGKAESADRRADESAKREQDDLAAQQSMAESTEQIVIISWFQFYLAAGGAAALIISLGLAINANSIARRVGKAQVRAYLSLKEIECRVRNDGFHVRFITPNKGQSPALDVTVDIAFKVELKSSGRQVSKMKHSRLAVPDIASGDDGISQWFIFSADFIEIARMVIDSSTGCVAIGEGVLWYKDVFNKRWEIPFCRFGFVDTKRDTTILGVDFIVGERTKENYVE